MNAVDKYHWKQYNRIAKRAGLKTLRFDEWDESLHERESNGQFAPKGGGDNSSSHSEEKSVKKVLPKSSKDFSHKNAHEFIGTLAKAKKSLSPEDGPWRVTSYDSADQFKDWHPNAKMHITDGGSTIAVSEDGDIVGVCHNKDDPTRGRELLKKAVENGGTKLDAYDGLFGFYTKCGFEPVSWCKFNEEYAPDDWKKGRDGAEDVIFFKYTGKPSKYANVREFKKTVEASADYDSAKEVREKDMEDKKR